MANGQIGDFFSGIARQTAGEVFNAAGAAVRGSGDRASGSDASGTINQTNSAGAGASPSPAAETRQPSVAAQSSASMVRYALFAVAGAAVLFVVVKLARKG